MSNELTATASLRLLKGGVDLTRSLSKQIDMSGDHHNYTIADVTTTVAAVPTGSVATIGLCVYRNTDATNTVSVGTTISATYRAHTDLPPGEWTFYRARTGTTPQLKNEGSGTVKVEVWVVEA